MLQNQVQNKSILDKIFNSDFSKDSSSSPTKKTNKSGSFHEVQDAMRATMKRRFQEIKYHKTQSLSKYKSKC